MLRLEKGVRPRSCSATPASGCSPAVAAGRGGTARAAPVRDPQVTNGQPAVAASEPRTDGRENRDDRDRRGRARAGAVARGGRGGLPESKYFSPAPRQEAAAPRLRRRRAAETEEEFAGLAGRVAGQVRRLRASRRDAGSHGQTRARRIVDDEPPERSRSRNRDRKPLAQEAPRCRSPRSAEPSLRAMTSRRTVSRRPSSEPEPDARTEAAEPANVRCAASRSCNRDRRDAENPEHGIGGTSRTNGTIAEAGDEGRADRGRCCRVARRGRRRAGAHSHQPDGARCASRARAICIACRAGCAARCEAGGPAPAEGQRPADAAARGAGAAQRRSESKPEPHAPRGACREIRTALHQRPAARRPGDHRPDRQGAAGPEGRAHHLAHRAARPLPGLHADRRPHRRLAQDPERRRAPAPEAHPAGQPHRHSRRLHRAHRGRRPDRRRTARRHAFPLQPLAGHPAEGREEARAGADPSRSRSRRSASCATSSLQPSRASGWTTKRLRERAALRAALPAGAGEPRQAVHARRRRSSTSSTSRRSWRRRCGPRCG